jgi:ATP-dependent exoDNAse (exonuclease V) alpha subunit
MKMSVERNLKIVSVGDSNQLESISKGNAFKAILEQTGFAVLKDITRQVDDKDKLATVNLGEGKTGLAIQHYADKDCIFIQNKELNEQAIVDEFIGYLDRKYDNKSDNYKIKDSIVLAYTREDVLNLNTQIRSKLVDLKLVDKGIDVNINVDKQDIVKSFGVGDRIILLGNKKLDCGNEVKNGIFAEIKSIDDKLITFVTDENKSRKITIDSEKYKTFDHGYATTVHKAQGATVKNTLNYVSNNNWDSHLTYVAMSRHKHNMKMFVNNDAYDDLEKLKRGLSSKSNKEKNALEFVEKRIKNKFVTKVSEFFGKENNDYEISQKQSDINSKYNIVSELADINKEVGREYYKLLDNINEAADDSQLILQKKNEYRNQLAYKVAQNLEKLLPAIEENKLDLYRVPIKMR